MNTSTYKHFFGPVPTDWLFRVVNKTVYPGKPDACFSPKATRLYKHRHTARCKGPLCAIHTSCSMLLQKFRLKTKNTQLDFCFKKSFTLHNTRISTLANKTETCWFSVFVKIPHRFNWSNIYKVWHLRKQFVEHSASIGLPILLGLFILLHYVCYLILPKQYKSLEKSNMKRIVGFNNFIVLSFYRQPAVYRQRQFSMVITHCLTL